MTLATYQDDIRQRNKQLLHERKMAADAESQRRIEEYRRTQQQSMERKLHQGKNYSKDEICRKEKAGDDEIKELCEKIHAEKKRHCEQMLKTREQHEAEVLKVGEELRSVINSNLEEMRQEDLHMEIKLKTAKLAYNEKEKDLEQEKEKLRLKNEEKINEYNKKNMDILKEQERILAEDDRVFNIFQKEQADLLDRHLDEHSEKIKDHILIPKHTILMNMQKDLIRAMTNDFAQLKQKHEEVKTIVQLLHEAEVNFGNYENGEVNLKKFLQISNHNAIENVKEEQKRVGKPEIAQSASRCLDTMNFLNVINRIPEPTDKQKIEAVEQKIFEELLKDASDERNRKEEEEKQRIFQKYQKELKKGSDEIKEKLRKVEKDIAEQKTAKTDKLRNLKKKNEKEIQKLISDLEQKAHEKEEEIKNEGRRLITEQKEHLDSKREQISRLSRSINKVKILKEYKIQLLDEEKEAQAKAKTDRTDHDNEQKRKLEENRKKKEQMLEIIEETRKKLTSEFRTEKNDKLHFALEMESWKVTIRYELIEALNKENEFERFQNDCNHLIDAFTEFERYFDSDNKNLLMARDDIEDGVKSMCNMAESLRSLEVFANQVVNFNTKMNETENAEILGKTLGDLSDNLKSLLEEINKNSRRYERDFDSIQQDSTQSNFSIKSLYEKAKSDISSMKKALLNLHTRHTSNFDKLLALQIEDLKNRSKDMHGNKRTIAASEMNP